MRGFNCHFYRKDCSGFELVYWVVRFERTWTFFFSFFLRCVWPRLTTNLTLFIYIFFVFQGCCSERKPLSRESSSGESSWSGKCRFSFVFLNRGQHFGFVYSCFIIIIDCFYIILNRGVFVIVVSYILFLFYYIFPFLFLCLDVERVFGYVVFHDAGWIELVVGARTLA